MHRLSAPHSVEAVLFDMNGTLRVREPHPETQQAAHARLCRLLGIAEPADEFWNQLARRQKAYSRWAQQNLIQLPEAEIWADWLLPGLEREKFEPVAAELMLAWAERKGRTVPRPGAERAIGSLKRHGYRLGLISNSMSSLDIPRSLDAFGWTGYFDAVVLSSQTGVRKPSPQPFLEAARRIGADPARCAYLGNRLLKDILGCKRAGYALAMILEPVSGPRPDEPEQDVRPDVVIHSLGELLEIFPGRDKR